MQTLLTGVAHPWQCDVIGHLTTRFYVALFDDSSYHLLSRVSGWSCINDPEGKVSWVDVRHTIDYLAEVHAGNLLEIRAGLTKIGGKSMTAKYEMLNLTQDTVAATLEAIYVHFDLNERKAVVIDDAMRAKLSRFLLPDE